MLMEIAIWTGGFGLLVLGLMSLLQVPKILREARKDNRAAARAVGQVIELIEEPATGPDARASTWHPVVKFTAQDGREYTVRVRYGTTPSKWSVGDSIKVAYAPSRPVQAEIDTPFMAYQPVFIAILIGIVSLVFGYVLLTLAMVYE